MPTALHDRKIVHFHVPKTAGTWTHEALVKRGGKRVDLGHSRARENHDRWRGYTRFSTIRDPWSWYASWYGHALSNSAHRRLGAMCGSERKREYSFRDALYGATHNRLSGQGETAAVIIDGMRPEDVRPGEGLYSSLVRWILALPDGTLGVDLLIDTAQVNEALGELLGELVDDEPANVRGASQEYRSLYDAEMLAWVAEADRFVIDLMGYGRPFTPAPQHTVALVEAA